MKLRDYLASEKISAVEFGRRIKVSQASVTRYAAGDRIPEPEVMRRIARVTQGAVAPNDFYRVTPRDPRKPRHSAKAAQWRREKPNAKAIAAWNEWIEENGIPFAGLRPW